jgi:glycosyltransferase involved in cell wall biosynthesis
MLNIIIPASNEAGLIGACLEALLATRCLAQARVIVVANGCRDDTGARARHFDEQFCAKGWELEVIELERGHKPGALNAGDRACVPGPRAYLDADVEVSPGLMMALVEVLSHEGPAYASGQVNVTAGQSRTSRAYARLYAQVPFFTHGVPGCGLFAVNEAGRARWGDFPDIISDDTFVRLSFTPEERHLVEASYDWPVVEGWDALVRVRRRQEAGVAELEALHPELKANDDARPSTLPVLLRNLLRDPLGVGVYTAVNMRAKRTMGRNTSWSRGR